MGTDTTSNAAIACTLTVGDYKERLAQIAGEHASPYPEVIDGGLANPKSLIPPTEERR